MQRGYIKLWRKIQDNPIWTAEKFTRGQAWIDLIMLASHKDGYFRKRGIKVEQKRGVVGVSILGLADRWQWSRGKVQRFLDELETVQQIEQQKSRLTTLIKIINYDHYQPNGTTDKTTNDTTDGQQTDTINNDKNVNKKERNIKERKPDSAPFRFRSAVQIPDDFWPTTEMRAWFNDQGFKHTDFKEATEQFVDYWRGKGTKRKDWSATWRNGIRLQEKWAKEAVEKEKQRQRAQEVDAPYHSEFPS